MNYLASDETLKSLEHYKYKETKLIFNETGSIVIESYESPSIRRIDKKIDASTITCIAIQNETNLKFQGNYTIHHRELGINNRYRFKCVYMDKDPVETVAAMTKDEFSILMNELQKNPNLIDKSTKELSTKLTKKLSNNELTDSKIKPLSNIVQKAWNKLFNNRERNS